MRLLLDECVPKALKQELTTHDVTTVQEMGWAGTGNGALLHLAAHQFDALVTVDQGLEYQQDLSDLSIAVVVLIARSNDVGDLRPLIPEVIDVLSAIHPGQLVRVGASRG